MAATTTLGSPGGGVTIAGGLSVTKLKNSPDGTYSGTWTAATLTTGSQTGTAGSGTTTTSLVKPTGANNWTASEMRGMFLDITSGGGSTATRPIIDNSTTTITVHAITGLDNTSVFQIVDPELTITSATIENNLEDVTIENFIVDKLTSIKNTKVTIKNCKLATSDADGSLDSDADQEIVVDGCYLASSASIIIAQADIASVTNTVLQVASTAFQSCKKVTTGINAEDCAAAAVHCTQCLHVLCGLEADSNDVTPLHLEGCNFFEPTGVGVTGTTNTGYGVEMEKGGYYDMTGVTLDGTTNDFIVEATAYSWATLAANDTIMTRGTSVVVIT